MDPSAALPGSGPSPPSQDSIPVLKQMSTVSNGSVGPLGGLLNKILVPRANNRGEETLVQVRVRCVHWVWWIVG